jgi:ABC-type amino acid transport substrate-binding protein
MKQLLVIIPLLFSAATMAQTVAGGPASLDVAANTAPDVQRGASPAYLVGVKAAKPFAYEENGSWKGYSLDLLDRLAEENGFAYELVDLKNMPMLLRATETSQVHFSIAAISMTPERERVLDFSHPYFTTIQGIISKNDQSLIWWSAKRIGMVLAIFIVGLYVIGFIMDKGDGNDAIDNAHKGAWWTLVTFTTTGYGDIVPATPRGKVLAAFVMLFSLFALPMFTAYITSAWTVQKLAAAPMTVEDLHRVKTVTMPGTTSSRMLTSLGIRHKTTDDLDTALAFLEGGQFEAVVYDKAMLDYASQNMDGDYGVFPIHEGLERYAIAFPSGSPLREEINVSILKVVGSDSWKAVTRRYFGTN